MIADRRKRLSERLQDESIEHCLLSSLVTLRYFTDYRATVEIEPSPMTPLLGAFWGIRSQQPGLFRADMEPGEGIDGGVLRESFSSVVIDRPTGAIRDPSQKLVTELRPLPKGKVGIEPEEIPAALLDLLRWRAEQAKLGANYSHHTGQGLGISWHEEPRIVPYNTIPLEPDMIIALEPGMYFEDKWGMRLEYVVRVMASGAELLSQFRHEL